MGNLKLSTNQFIGSKELQKFREFIDDDGYKLLLQQDSFNWGLTHVAEDGLDWINGQVSQGTNAGTFKHDNLFAIDKFANFLNKTAEDNITIVDDSTWYWIKIAYEARSYEEYDVDIDASGNITVPLSNGNFTSILRGQPNIASRVSFPNASLNTAEYDVQSVTDNNNAILQGSFLAETTQKMIVVGTFTPDSNPDAGDKDIFQYDHALITQVQSDAQPSATPGYEFFLARVKRTGASVLIEDKRRLNIYRSKADYQAHNTPIEGIGLDLIGLEGIKFTKQSFSTRQNNIIDIGWGFRSDNFTTNPSTKLVTLNAGSGGTFKITASFQTGDFDSWRLYANGKFHKIVQSTRTGGQIDLILDSFDEDDLAAATEVVCTPNADQISIRAMADSSNSKPNIETIRTFPIATGFGTMELLVHDDPTADYYFQYSFDNNNEKTEWTVFSDDDSLGYYAEDRYDSDGVFLGSGSRTPYNFTGNFPTLTLAADAFSNIVGRVDLGDSPGVAYNVLDNGNPVKALSVGTNKQTQIWTGPLTLSTDNFISLETTGAVEGNIFYLKFENDVSLSGDEWKIVQDYINPGSPGTTLVDFVNATDFWRDRAAEANMFVWCEFDGTDWVAYPDSSVTQAILDLVQGGSVLLTGSVSTGVQKYDADPTLKGGWDARSWPDRQYVDDEVSASYTAIVDGAPANLNTLNEIAAAIDDDPNYLNHGHPFGDISGTVPINQGGTGTTALTAGQVVLGHASVLSTVSRSGVDTRASYPPANHSAATITSGTLVVGRGGTGSTGLTSGQVVLGGGASALNTISRSGVDSRSDFPSTGHAPTVHQHAGADINSGTLPNARIQATGVTQHQASLTGGWTQTGVVYYGSSNRFNIQWASNSLMVSGDGSTAAISILFREITTTRFTFDVDGTGTGEATAIDWIATSDKRLKDNIRYHQDWWDDVKKIGRLAVKYNLKEHIEKGHKQDKIGFIAQDIEPIIPEFVKHPREEDGMLGLYYEKMVAPLYQVLGEALSRIEELENK